MKTETKLATVPPISTGAARGERLYPPRKSSLYWVLTELRHAYESVVREYEKFLKGAILVDYGCGNMPYRPLFDSLIADYIGCDFTGNELASSLLLENGGIAIENATVDVVLSSQVLEHVPDAAFYLGEASRVLRPNGLLVLSTHGVWRYHPDPTDFWRWTCDGLRRQIEKSGFSVEQLRGVMGPEATALQIWQDAVSSRIHWRLAPLFFRYVQWRIERADKRCSAQSRNRDACVYVVVARKKTGK